MLNNLAAHLLITAACGNDDELTVQALAHYTGNDDGADRPTTPEEHEAVNGARALCGALLHQLLGAPATTGHTYPEHTRAAVSALLGQWVEDLEAGFGEVAENLEDLLGATPTRAQELACAKVLRQLVA